MVTLVTRTERFFKGTEIAEVIKTELPEVVSVIQNINPEKTNVIMGREEKVLFGKSTINDTLLGKVYQISPQSFYQVNTEQTEVLYQTAIEFADLNAEDIVVDAYCGIGTIGLSLAEKVKHVYGVEIVPQAIEDAKANAKKNGIENVNYEVGKAEKIMPRWAREGIEPSVIFVDPPRKGLDEKFIEASVAVNPERIIYISCNPATLARDLRRYEDLGYHAVKVQPVDLFPQTYHVETVVLLSHKKPDGHINVKVEFGEGEGKVPLDNIAKRAEEYKPKERVTYKMIKEYIEAKYGFKVHTAYIAEVKRDLGLPMYDAPNAVEELKQPRKHPTAEKVEAIKDALKHFEVI